MAAASAFGAVKEISPRFHVASEPGRGELAVAGYHHCSGDSGYIQRQFARIEAIEPERAGTRRRVDSDLYRATCTKAVRTESRWQAHRVKVTADWRWRTAVRRGAARRGPAPRDSHGINIAQPRKGCKLGAESARQMGAEIAAEGLAAYAGKLRGTSRCATAGLRQHGA